MTKPLPSIADDSITPSNSSVGVTAIASKALVDLLVAGASIGSGALVDAHCRHRRGLANLKRS